MTMNEVLQNIKMCIQTHINLYGYLPTLAEMLEQLDAPAKLIQRELNEYAGNLMAGMPSLCAA